MVTPTVVAPESIQPADVTEPILAVEPAPVGTSAPAAGAAPTAVSTPTDRPVVQPRESEELIALRRQVAENEAEKQLQAFEATLTAEAQQVYREELAAGQTEDDARRISQRHYVLAKRVGQEQQRLQQEQQFNEGKRNAAAHFGRVYGVDPTLLMVANTPQDMQAIGEREKRYAAQEVRLKALEQGRVQPQTLDSSNGSRAGSVVPTRDNIDKLWLDYERDHPGMSNPFEAQYRKFLQE